MCRTSNRISNRTSREIMQKILIELDISEKEINQLRLEWDGK